MGSTKTFTFSLSTMGCKANLTDSQTLEARLRAMGGRPVADSDGADLFVLNTCTVTDQADREAMQILRKRKSPLTVVTGCLAEVDSARLEKASADGGSKVVIARNSAKGEIDAAIAAWLEGALEEQQKTLQGDRAAWHTHVDFEAGAAGAIEKSEHRTRAFLKVQDGCNAYCAYCIIPRARGKSRSVAAADVVREVQALVDTGVKEVVLTAIHAADYDSDGLDFTGLVEKVLLETTVPRLRLTSLDPAEIPSRLIDLMVANARLCPHFHVSMQSASSSVLKAMKRHYDAVKAEGCLNEIKAKLPHAFIGMDIIAGFPGESDEEFAESYALLERTPWSKLHVFPFSVRQGTAAAKLVELGQAVPAHKIQERARLLRELSQRKMQAALEQKVGSVAEILVEEKLVKVGTRMCSQGYTRSYHRVLVPGRREPNSLVRVKILATAEKEYLKGEII